MTALLNFFQKTVKGKTHKQSQKRKNNNQHRLCYTASQKELRGRGTRREPEKSGIVDNAVGAREARRGPNDSQDP